MLVTCKAICMGTKASCGQLSLGLPFWGFTLCQIPASNSQPLGLVNRTLALSGQVDRPRCNVGSNPRRRK